MYKKKKHIELKLRMEKHKIVFILGAGASTGAGAPSLNNFLPIMFGKVKEYYPQMVEKLNLKKNITRYYSTWKYKPNFIT